MITQVWGLFMVCAKRSKYNVNKCGRVTIFMQLFIFFWQMVEKSWSVFHDNWILSRKSTIANIHSMWTFNLFKREVNVISYNWINCFLSVIQVWKKFLEETYSNYCNFRHRIEWPIKIRYSYHSWIYIEPQKWRFN